MKYLQPYDQPDTPTAPYVDLDAAHGVDGSIPPAKLFNDVQHEILNVIIGGGLTPDGGDQGQLLEAILALIPTPTGAPSDASLVHWGSDAGAQNALAVTPTPGFTSLASGFTLWTIPAYDNTGAATIALTPSSGPALTRDIKRSDGSVLQAGDLKAGVLACLVVDVSGALRMHRDERKTGLINVQLYTLSGTYAPTSSARNILAFAIGGGGAGGNGVGSASSGGGGAGAMAMYFGAAVAQTIIIGAGGAPNPSYGADLQGGQGGQTSFGSLAVAGGGTGGSVST